jgi:hypothetical protein
MESVLLDAAGHHRSPATLPGYHHGRAPRNKGLRYPADPPTIEASSPIARGDVDRAAPRAEESLDRSIYEVRIQRATIKERRYLRAMAELGDGPYKVGAVAKTMGSTTTALSTVRQKLLDRGLIYATEDYGYIDFTVPRFDEFMRRNIPFRSPPRRSRRTS